MTIQYTSKRISELQGDLYKIQSKIQVWGYASDQVERKSKRTSLINHILRGIREIKKTLEIARGLSARTKSQ